MDISTGYCEIWEKLTNASFVCDQFVDREQFKRDQAAMYDEMEDDEGGED
jgi:hypothetical protein